MNLHHGDCLDVMAAMEPESVDAIVTDPPYDLTSQHGPRPPQYGNGIGAQQERANRGQGGFMSMRWDGEGIAFRRETWEAAYRVAKPSTYLLAFGGTRTVHRMTVALEDAGWVIRDMLVWGYASGFPKSKASLKPAWEPIVMARKPGPLRMLAIDACRLPLTGDEAPDDGQHQAFTKANRPRKRQTRVGGGSKGSSGFAAGYERGDGFTENVVGRWPANIVLTDPIFDGGIEGVIGGGDAGPAGVAVKRNAHGRSGGYGGWAGDVEAPDAGYGDSGTYSRFFLIPKADRSDREPVLGGLPERPTDIGDVRPSGEFNERLKGTTTPHRQNVHPTVKPTDLMRHLVRLVTPAGGVVLDPFLGSGTTALAAEMEGFAWVGIEREAEYVAIAEARLNGTQRGIGL